MDKRIKGLLAACCSLGVALLGTGPSWSAVDKEAALPMAELDELEQIVINGKRIEQRILESEQRLYERYNALNTKDFDVDCSAKWNDGKSSGYGTAQYRSGCVPLFLANAMAANLTHSRGWTTCQPFMRTSTGWSSLAGSRLRTPSGGRSVAVSPPGFSCVSDSSIASPGAHLMWLERRDAFKVNLNSVIRSDPQLQALAREFNSLMQENDDALKVAAEARKRQVELRQAARKCPAPSSPRAATRACRSG